MSHLLTKLLEVKEKHASGGEGSTASIQEREYILSIYLSSCIEDDDRIATEVESQLKDIKWGEPLGSGGFAHVSEVTWLQQLCALKRIHNCDPKEVQISRGCNHPHIVQFFWFWEHERTSNIIMERMPEDLSKHIQRLVERNGGRPFQLHVAIDIMLQIAKAMRYLHNKKPRKILHRDLKTSNILVRPLADNSQGYVHVKLADFGISKFYNMSETSSSLTFRKGTSVYAAPEVFNQQSKYVSDSSNLPPKIDVWSFAMVCSEILTGTMPFDGELRGNLHAKIEENDEFRPPLPSDCPEDLRFCITRCWECNPRERPAFVEICKMLKIAKAQSLGIMHFDSSKPLVSINDPMLTKPTSR
jgi:serine/threonine protein kinase